MHEAAMAVVTFITFMSTFFKKLSKPAFPATKSVFQNHLCSTKMIVEMHGLCGYGFKNKVTDMLYLAVSKV
jgi:hypothetical protein